MKHDNPDIQIYPIYDLANPHFSKVEIITAHNEKLVGQFVRYRVVCGAVEYLQPSEKYCFLPESHHEEYWATYLSTNGEFKCEPSYIRHLSLSEIHEIKIIPNLVI